MCEIQAFRYFWPMAERMPRRDKPRREIYRGVSSVGRATPLGLETRAPAPNNWRLFIAYYTAAYLVSRPLTLCKFGAPERSRTPNPQIRSLVRADIRG